MKQAVGQPARSRASWIRSIDRDGAAAGLRQDSRDLARSARRHQRRDRDGQGSRAKLGPLAQLQELSQSTEERLNALNALAEHVSHKAKALESQQQAIEHAVVQANRVNEMVWSMDVQIGKLNEGLKQVAKAEESLGRDREADSGNKRTARGGVEDAQEAERDTSKLTKEGPHCSTRFAARWTRWR